MKTYLRTPWLVLSTALLTCPAWSAILTFDDLPALLGEDPPSFEQFSEVNGGSLLYGGVTWDDGWWVVNDSFIPHNDPSDMFTDANTLPFAHPHSGHYAIFNGFGERRWGFDTSMFLTGVWFSRGVLADGEDPGGATNVIVLALSGESVLASISIALVDSEPVFLDTSAFLGLSGITRYEIDAYGPGTTGRAFFIADDFQFASLSPVDVCPCDAPWRNQAEYVRCVREAVSLLHDDGALTHNQAVNIIKNARKSDCGDGRP